MNIPLFDKVLLMLFVCTSVLLADTMAFADPPPDECDNFCRERRFFKNKDKDGKFQCVMVKYRTCFDCRRQSGKCKRNIVEDKLPEGKCPEFVQVKQETAFPNPADCDAMCPFPAELGVAAVREAAEGATTYTDINQWQPQLLGVFKCYVLGQPIKEWGNEGVKWMPPKE